MMDEPLEIVCLCFGNICRSPMMEALLQRALDDRFGEGRFMVTGAGVGADDGRPPSQGTVRALERRGIDFRRHRSRALTPSIARGAWRIYATETYQVQRAQAFLEPADQHKVRLMGGEEIDDPYGSNDQAYETVAVQVERLIPMVVEEIASELS